jgi:hypothetical protein
VVPLLLIFCVVRVFVRVFLLATRYILGSVWQPARVAALLPKGLIGNPRATRFSCLLIRTVVRQTQFPHQISAIFPCYILQEPPG